MIITLIMFLVLKNMFCPEYYFYFYLLFFKKKLSLLNVATSFVHSKLQVTVK